MRKESSFTEPMNRREFLKKALRGTMAVAASVPFLSLIKPNRSEAQETFLHVNMEERTALAEADIADSRKGIPKPTSEEYCKMFQEAFDTIPPAERKNYINFPEGREGIKISYVENKRTYNKKTKEYDKMYYIVATTIKQDLSEVECLEELPEQEFTDKHILYYRSDEGNLLRLDSRIIYPPPLPYGWVTHSVRSSKVEEIDKNRIRVEKRSGGELIVNDYLIVEPKPGTKQKLVIRLLTRELLLNKNGSKKID